MKRITIALLLLFFANFGKSESIELNKVVSQYRLDCVEHVLSKGIEGVAYYFEAKYPDANGGSRDCFFVKKLGGIKNKKFGMLTFVDIRGVYSSSSYEEEGASLSDSVRRRYGRVVLYNHRNKNLGFYYTVDEYPHFVEIKGDSLMFSSYKDDCNVTTAVHFGDSLRRAFLMMCNDTIGIEVIYNPYELKKED